MAKVKINSRRKGKEGELELATTLNTLLGCKLLERNLVQSRDGGHDLVVNDPTHCVGKRLDELAIEIKTP